MIGDVLHVRVKLSCAPDELATVLVVFEIVGYTPPLAKNAALQLFDEAQTLHPVPVHPASHEQAGELTFPEDELARERLL